MNIWKSIILFVFMSVGLLSFKVDARKPAVEPVMGLSIEEYEHPAPSDSQGFNFEQGNKPQNTNSSETTTATERKPLQTFQSQDSTQVEKESPKTLFYVLISLLPFVVWFGVMKNLEEVDIGEHTKTADMFDLEEQRQKKNQDDQDNYPKAS